MIIRMVKLLIIVVLMGAMVPRATSEMTQQELDSMRQKAAQGMKESAEIVKQMAESVAKTATTASKVLNIASKIGSAFQFVGPAFAILSVILPGDTDALSDDIRNGFNYMTQRFDQLDREVKEVKEEVLKLGAYASYKTAHEAINAVWADYKNCHDFPKDTVYKNKFNATCTDQNTRPDQRLQSIYSYVVLNDMGIDLLKAMLTDSHFYNNKLVELLQIIIADAVNAAFLEQACLQLQPGDTKTTMTNTANNAGTKIEAIYNKLDSFKEQYRTSLFKEELIKDMNETLLSSKTTPQMQTTNDLSVLLNKKFSFAHWTAIMVHKGKIMCAQSTYAMYPQETGDYNHMIRLDELTLFVTWSSVFEYQKLVDLKNEADRVIKNLHMEKPTATSVAYQLNYNLRSAKSVLVIDPRSCTYGAAGMHTHAGDDPTSSNYVAVSF